MKVRILAIVVMILAGAATAFAGAEATWSYSGDTGPDKWGALSPYWVVCNAGHYQSPIDIRGSVKAGLAPLAAKIKPTPLKFGLDGPTFAVPYQSGSWITVNDTRYEIQAFHFHHLSEHTVNGKHFPMESHMVLRSEGSKHNNAVMGVFIDVGKANPMLNQFWNQLPRTRNKPVDPVMVNVGDLLPGDKSYYMYEGSMTTPGCPQGVRWFVLKTPVEASQAQIDQFIQDFTEGKTNNRPIQQINGRFVLESQ